MRPIALRLAAALLTVAAGSAGLYLAAQTDMTSGQAPAAALPAPAGTAPAAPIPSGAPAGKPQAPRPRGAVAPAPNKPGAPAAQLNRPGPAQPAAASWRRLRDRFWAVAVDATSLARATVAEIALLAAFLTVVQTWQIPPPSTPPASPQSAPAGTPLVSPQSTPAAAGKDPARAAGTPRKIATDADKATGPFDSNFARTVFTGLGGMFAVTFLDSVWATKGFNAKSYYLVLFVVFFLTILFFFAALRAAGEALRSRVAVPFRARARQCIKPCPGAQYALEPRLSYYIERSWAWLLSWRSSLLVFWDTAFNVIQGKNQLQTVVFQNSIIELQTSLVRATSQVCQEVHAAVIEALRDSDKKEIDSHKKAIDYWDVRVNVSMLSDDEEFLFYIAWETGSLSKSFPRISLAWIAVFSGEARWYKDGYKEAQVTKDPVTLALLGDKKPLVKDYYQDRGPVDYKEFIVLPIPWGRRGEGGLYRRAGLHISFREEGSMGGLWDNLDKPHDAKQPKGHAAAGEAPDDQGARGRNPPAHNVALASHAADGEAANGKAPDVQPNYDAWPGLLGPVSPPPAQGQQQPAHGQQRSEIVPHDPTLRAVLKASVDMLAELLRHFNQQIFEDYIRPRIEL